MLFVPNTSTSISTAAADDAAATTLMAASVILILVVVVVLEVVGSCLGQTNLELTVCIRCYWDGKMDCE